MARSKAAVGLFVHVYVVSRPVTVATGLFVLHLPFYVRETELRSRFVQHLNRLGYTDVSASILRPRL